MKKASNNNQVIFQNGNDDFKRFKFTLTFGTKLFAKK